MKNKDQFYFQKLWMLFQEQQLYLHDLITRDVAAKFVMILSLINVIICFYPSYTLVKQPHDDVSINSTFNAATNTTMSTEGTDDYVGSFDSTTVIYGASLSCLMITIPSACDCVIDMIPQWIVIALFKDRRYSNAQNQAKQHGDDAGIKMTIAERLMFIIGVITMSAATYPDLQGFGKGRTMIWYGFANSNTTLVIFPLLAFLTRYSSIFTPIRTIVLSFVIFLAPLLTTIGYGYTNTNLTIGLRLAYASNISIMIATAIFGTLMVISFVSALMNVDRVIDGKKPDENKLANERFRAVVIGAHMLCTLVTLLVQSLWFWYAGITSLTPNQLVMILFSSIGAATLVFVVEFRVRKNEFMQALYTLLDSKRTYVRYVSHELRTPLNAAFLGLKLITDRLQDSTDEAEQEMYEVLNDVQLACNTSVEILNDLLCFDKIEGGILELHKQEVPVIRFVTETCRQFTGQARERGIKLLIDVTSTTHTRSKEDADFTAPRGPSFESLVNTDEELTLLSAADTCLLDKFKMEQVLRNLVSNALKFSSSGSTVTVNAYFVPSITGEEWLHEGGRSKDATTQGGRHLARRRRMNRNRSRGNMSSVLSNVSNAIQSTAHHFSEKGKRYSQSGKEIGIGMARKLSGGGQKEGRMTSRVYLTLNERSSILDVMEAGTAGISDPHNQQQHQIPQQDENLATKTEGMTHIPMTSHNNDNNNNKMESSHINAGTTVTASAPTKKRMSKSAITYNSNAQDGHSAAGGGGVLGYEIGVLNAVKNGNGEEKGLGDDGEEMVTIRGRRGRLIITVTDTGPGISPENQKRLFKEVVQFSPEKLQAGGGSGFGLFISQGIIDLHDGCMGVYSQGEGHGATFSITIPMIRQAFGTRGSITRLNLQLSQANRQSQKSEHGHPIDLRRISQKSQSHRVPSLNLTPPSGDNNSRRHSTASGVVDDAMGVDILVDADDFVFRGESTTGRTTGSGSKQHTVGSEDHFNSSNHNPNGDRRRSRPANQGSEPVSSSEGTHRSGGTGTHRSKTSGQDAGSTPSGGTANATARGEWGGVAVVDGLGGLRHLESSAMAGLGGFVVDPRIGTDRSGQSIGSNKETARSRSNKNSARDQGSPRGQGSAWSPNGTARDPGSVWSPNGTARSMRYDSPIMSGNDTDREGKKVTPNRSKDNLAVLSVQLQPLPPNQLPHIQRSHDVHQGNSINNNFHLSEEYQNDNTAGGGGETKGEQSHGPQRNILQRNNKLLDNEEEESQNNTTLSLPNESTINNMHRRHTTNSIDVHRSNKSNKSGYSEKVGFLHLLVVDDSGMSRKMLTRVLCGAGHTCDQAENGQIAVEKMRANMAASSNVTNGGATKLYDAVLTDFEMPVMNGPTSVREMRMIGYKKPIIGITGNGLSDQIAFFKDAGCNEVFIKPFDLDMFNKAMESVQK